MQNLQQPYPLKLYGKSLVWRVGAHFSWLESYTVTANSLPYSTEPAGNRLHIYMGCFSRVLLRAADGPKLALYFSADVSDCFPSPPARATAPRLRVRVPLGANRPVRGPVVRRVQDRFRMREV